MITIELDRDIVLGLRAILAQWGPLFKRARAAGYSRKVYSAVFHAEIECVWRRDSGGYVSLTGSPTHDYRLIFEREARPGADHEADFRVRLDTNRLTPETVAALAEQFGFLAPVVEAEMVETNLHNVPTCSCKSSHLPAEFHSYACPVYRAGNYV